MEVAQWLREQGFGEYEDNFVKHNVNGSTLRTLEAKDLEELGVSTVGHRKQLIAAIIEEFGSSAAAPQEEIAETAEGTTNGLPAGETVGQTGEGQVAGGTAASMSGLGVGDRIKLFVGHIAEGTSQAELQEVFERHVPVEEIIIQTDRITGRAKGAAFVIVLGKQTADRAIAALHERVTMPGAFKPMKVDFASGEAERLQQLGLIETKLFIGNLPSDIQEQQIMDMMAPYSGKDVFVIRPRVDGGRCSAFVNVPSHGHAAMAIETLNEKYMFPNSQGGVVVKFKETQEQKNARKFGGMGGMQGAMMNPMMQQYAAMGYNMQGFQQQGGFGAGFGGQMGGFGGGGMQSNQAVGPRGANVFCRNLPFAVTEDDLSQLFGGFGQILSVRVIRDKSTGQSRGYGFVSYSTAAAAHAAVNSMNGYMYSGRKMQISIKEDQQGRPQGQMAAAGMPY